MNTTRFTTLTLALPALIIALAASAEGERSVQVYKFATDSAAPTVVRLDSDVMGFHVSELADGESRVVTTEDGQVVTLSRNGDTLNIGVDGETFDVPFSPQGPMGIGEDGDHGMRLVKKVMHTGEGLTILSDEPLDEATQETIRAALADAGIDKAVTFGSHDFDIDIVADHDVHEWNDGAGHKRIVIKKSPD